MHYTEAYEPYREVAFVTLHYWAVIIADLMGILTESVVHDLLNWRATYLARERKRQWEW